MKAMVFAKRNLKELLRDPLSYIFCLGFPLIMLAVMTAINSLIPPEAGMALFEIRNLTPGIAVFGLSFVMLFATLSVSKDRSGAFLTRLFSSPMTAFDFITGYVLPLIIMSIGQIAISFIVGAVIGAIEGTTFNLTNALLSSISLLPCSVFFIGTGIFFGALFNEKAAPPASSIIISICGVLGGIWFDLGIIPEGNFFGIICRALPFSHSVDISRSLLNGNYDAVATPFIISTAWAIGVLLLSILTFNLKMRSDKK